VTASTSQPGMKIGALAPWFGGKRTLAPKIVRELGEHRAYWEPFCGGVSVLMAKPVARMETVNDLHGDVTNLARIVAHPTHGPAFYRRVRRLVVSDDSLAQADDLVRAGDWHSEALSLDRAIAFFVTCWMGRNGECGLAKAERGRYLAVRWTPSGGDSCTRWNSAVDSIPAWRRRLRDVMVLTRDGFDVLEKIRDEEGTAIYLDPPYLVKSDQYMYDFDEGFMGADDHSRLADLVTKRFQKARVVISYYDHPRLRELYPSWNIVACPMNKNMSSVSSPSKPKVANEILLINAPSFTKEGT
jgi:DNA adenine methylase